MDVLKAGDVIIVDLGEDDGGEIQAILLSPYDEDIEEMYVGNFYIENGEMEFVDYWIDSNRFVHKVGSVSEELIEQG